MREGCPGRRRRCVIRCDAMPRPPLRFLFRYRDLIEDSLRAHGEIVTRAGACWWGWWKRPHEDGRAAAWRAIDAAIRDSPQKRLRIGLFNTGAGSDGTAVRAVWIDAIRPPREEDGDLDPVPLEAGELELVPEYYRRSPFSRAWLRIVLIEEDPEDFFGKYSHREPPPLPGYEPGALAGLAGKVILDAAELRAMDTTIWEVAVSQPADSRARVLIPSPYLPPITSRPIEVRGDIILHLTDLHFALGARRAQHRWRLESESGGVGVTLAEAVSNAIRRKGSPGKVAVLLVTGDLTFVANRDEFNEAAASIRRLLATLDLGLDQVVVVPGNHDIAWTKGDEAAYDPPRTVDVAPKAARDAYVSFWKELFRADPEPSLAMGRRFVFPHGRLVEIGAVNSSSLEQGKNYLAGMGRIEGGGLDRLSARAGVGGRAERRPSDPGPAPSPGVHGGPGGPSRIRQGFRHRHRRQEHPAPGGQVWSPAGGPWPPSPRLRREGVGLRAPGGGRRGPEARGPVHPRRRERGLDGRFTTRPTTWA
jgi:hypothetical protein